MTTKNITDRQTRLHDIKYILSAFMDILLNFSFVSNSFGKQPSRRHSFIELDTYVCCPTSDSVVSWAFKTRGDILSRNPRGEDVSPFTCSPLALLTGGCMFKHEALHLFWNYIMNKLCMLRKKKAKTNKSYLHMNNIIILVIHILFFKKLTLF